MLLNKKTAIIYGAGGAIGSAVAQAYAREGAEVHAPGRPHRSEPRCRCSAHPSRWRNGSHRAGRCPRPGCGRAARQCCRHGRRRNRRLLNATSNDDVQGTPLLDMQFEDFMRPVTNAVTGHFNRRSTTRRPRSGSAHGENRDPYSPSSSPRCGRSWPWRPRAYRRRPGYRCR